MQQMARTLGKKPKTPQPQEHCLDHAITRIMQVKIHKFFKQLKGN